MHKRIQTLCIKTGGLLGAGLFYAFICILAGRPLIPCLFHTVTGLYCPGCGGTRAVRLLCQGHILESLYYHPFVLYGALLYAWFMLSNSIEYLSRGKMRVGMRYRKWYVALGVIILALNFVIKNGVMLIWHYPMIK